MTGFNLPPGCTDRMIDEQAGVYDICDTCGQFVDSCICPECKVCGEVGNHKCYEEHGLKKTHAQEISLQKRHIADLEEDLGYEKMYLEWLQAGGSDQEVNP